MVRKKRDIGLTCKRGHPRDAENTNARGNCKPCAAMLAQEKRDQKKDGTYKPPSNFPRTHCKHGHLKTPDTVYKNNGCKVCNHAGSQRRYRCDKLKAKAVSRAYVLANKEHVIARQSEWQRNNFDKCKNARIKHKYGISLEEYNQRLVEQDNRCTICGTPFEPIKAAKPVIDHDHKCCSGFRSCGKCVRGIICSGCNIGLGGFKDNPQAMLKAMEYLKESTEQFTLGGA